VVQRNQPLTGDLIAGGGGSFRSWPPHTPRPLKQPSCFHSNVQGLACSCHCSCLAVGRGPIGPGGAGWSQPVGHWIGQGDDSLRRCRAVPPLCGKGTGCRARGWLTDAAGEPLCRESRAGIRSGQAHGAAVQWPFQADFNGLWRNLVSQLRRGTLPAGGRPRVIAAPRHSPGPLWLQQHSRV